MKHNLCLTNFTPELVLNLFNETAHLFDALNADFIIPPESADFMQSVNCIAINFGIAIETMSEGYTSAAIPELIYKALRSFNLTIAEFYELVRNNYTPMPPKFCRPMEMPEAVKKPTKVSDLNHITHYFFNPETFAGAYEK